MEYSKIVAITGLPGLFELVNSKTDGAIVRSLEDKSTSFVSSRVHSFSHLESIEVFTSEENVNLAEVLKTMDGSSEKLPNEKDAAALTLYFKKVYPKLDFDRVYNSDLRKMVKWFSVLKNNQVEFAAPPVPEIAAESAVKAESVPPAVEKTIKKKKEAPPAKEAAEKKTEKKAAKANPAEKKKKEVKEKAAKKETKKEKPAKKAAKKKK